MIDMNTELDALNTKLIAHELPAVADGSIYLNTGSCGRKPVSVLQAIERGWNEFNYNPTIETFIDQSSWHEARQAVFPGGR